MYHSIDMNFLWAVDIETVPSDKIEDIVNKMEFSAPSNYKDPDKIAAYIAERREAAKIDGGLSWMSGKIVSYAFVNVGDVANGIKPRTISSCGVDEKQLLEKMMTDMTSNSMMNLIGKTSEVFDFPYIRGRCIANDISMPDTLRNRYQLFDIDSILCGRQGTKQTGSLNSYLEACELPTKTGKGSEVYGKYLTALASKVANDMAGYKNKMMEIKDYNINDTVATAQLAYRLLRSR